MRTAVQEGGRGRQASGGSPAAERGGGTAGEDKRMGAVRPFPFPHRRKGFTERCAPPARQPVSFLRRRTPALSGRPFCRAAFSSQTERRGQSLRGWAFRTLRGSLCRLPDRRRAARGRRAETQVCLPHDFQKKEGLSPREGCGMQNGIRNRYARRDRLRRRRSGGRHRCEVPLPQIRSGPAVAPRQSLGTAAALPAGLEAGRSASGRFPARAERVSIRPAAFRGRGAARACGGRRRSAGACVKRRYTANPFGRRSARSVWERLRVFGAKPQDKR